MGNRDQQSQQRLQYKHKKEMKGAVREIRKDNQFLARQQLQERIERYKWELENLFNFILFYPFMFDGRMM